jgi:hypothetical protein
MRTAVIRAMLVVGGLSLTSLSESAEERPADVVTGFIRAANRGECVKWEKAFTKVAMAEIVKAMGSFQAYCDYQTEHGKVTGVDVDIDRLTEADEATIRYRVSFSNGDLHINTVWMRRDADGWKWSRVDQTLPIVDDKNAHHSEAH